MSAKQKACHKSIKVMSITVTPMQTAPIQKDPSFVLA